MVMAGFDEYGSQSLKMYLQWVGITMFLRDCPQTVEPNNRLAKIFAVKKISIVLIGSCTFAVCEQECLSSLKLKGGI